jgi:hypothetical protein
MGLKPLQPDYTGGTGDYNRMPSTPGNMGRGAYAMQPDTMYVGGSADFDESTGRYRSGYVPPDRGMGGNMGGGRGIVEPPPYVPPDRGMGGAVGTGLGNLAAGGVGGGRGIVQPPLYVPPDRGMGGAVGARLPFGPGMVDPRTMVGPQYDPRSIAFPANDYSNRGNSSMRDDIARRALMLRDQNAAARKGQDLGNYNMQDMVPYNANRRR